MSSFVPELPRLSNAVIGGQLKQGKCLLSYVLIISSYDTVQEKKILQVQQGETHQSDLKEEMGKILLYNIYCRATTAQ